MITSNLPSMQPIGCVGPAAGEPSKTDSPDLHLRAARSSHKLRALERCVVLSMLTSILVFSLPLSAGPQQGAVESVPPPLSADLYPEGVAGEQEYRDWLGAEHEALLRATAQASPPVLAKQLAFHADWTLAIRCEPQVTRLLIGLAGAEDATVLAALSSDALERLKRAGENWPTDDEEGLEKLELLTNLGRAVSLLAQSRLGQPDPAAMEAISIEMAMWIDDEDAEIANSALLWQSLIYRELGKSARALKALPLSLVPFKESRNNFFLRLLRCSLLADVGRHTLAIVLILRMEERCAQWFADESTQHSARCALTWLRIQIANSMPGNVDAFSRKTKQEWLERADSFLKDKEAACALLRLGHAAPMIFARPELEGKPTIGAEPPTDSSPAPTSQPINELTPPNNKEG